MDRNLNLIKNTETYEEKRVFPRFPFCSMTFKTEESNARVFHVNDISFSGMQLQLRNGDHELVAGDSYSGELHWQHDSVKIRVKVERVNDKEVGVSFEEQKGLKEFLSYGHIIAGIKTLHDDALGIEKPNNLKIWLQSAGAFELFVWVHNDGELSRFDIIFMDHFIEWTDGEGLKTGLLSHKRDLDTPLSFEDECTFQMDGELNPERIEICSQLLTSLTAQHLPEGTKEFIIRKLS